jgi:hypothetical protein
LIVLQARLLLLLKIATVTMDSIIILKLRLEIEPTSEGLKLWRHIYLGIPWPLRRLTLRVTVYADPTLCGLMTTAHNGHLLIAVDANSWNHYLLSRCARRLVLNTVRHTH